MTFITYLLLEHPTQNLVLVDVIKRKKSNVVAQEISNEILRCMDESNMLAHIIL